MSSHSHNTNMCRHAAAAAQPLPPPPNITSMFLSCWHLLRKFSTLDLNTLFLPLSWAVKRIIVQYFPLASFQHFGLKWRNLGID